MDVKKITPELLETFSKEQLIDCVLKLVAQVETLTKRVEELEGKNSPPKNSKNSSIPPSTDLKRKHNRSDRKNQYGPPKNHKGVSRKISTNPDEIVEIPITKCPRTGQPFKSNSKSYKRHQIIEIEPVRVMVIELRRQITTGPDGKTVVAPHPEGIPRYKRYGPNLKLHIAYMRFEQNVSWSRIWNYFKELVGLTLGIGTLRSIFRELKEDLEADYDALKKDIQEGTVVGCDETGFHVNGKKWWIHAAQTKDTTLYVASPSRGHAVLQEVLGADFTGRIVSDFWGGYSTKFYPKATFQKCVGGHLLRDIIYAIDCEGDRGTYAKQLWNIIFEALILKKFFIFGTTEYTQERDELEKRLNELLEQDVEKCVSEVKRLWKRLIKYRDHLFPFLYEEHVPSDNNGSERVVREVVCCRKVSEAYKTEEGLKELVLVKSVLQTLKKRGKNIVSRILQAFSTPRLNPE